MLRDEKFEELFIWRVSYMSKAWKPGGMERITKKIKRSIIILLNSWFR
jgi:hypothetical protein